FSDGNLILCEKNGIILQPFHRQEWKDRKLWKGEQYKFPASKENLLKEKENSFLEKARSAPSNLVSFLVAQYGLAPPVAEEIIWRSGAKKDGKALDNKQAESVLCSAREILEVRAEKLAPQRAEFQKEEWLLPFSFQSIKCKPIESFSAVLDEEFSSTLSGAEQSENTAGQRKKKGLVFSLVAQEKALLRFQQEIAEKQERGVWVQARAGEVEEVLQFVQELRKKGFKGAELEKELRKSEKKFVLFCLGKWKLDGSSLILEPDG
ncbi:MAG: hypothetical protein V1847_04620, partial [Candidatus Diapherotrites archaeon]